MKRLVFSDPSVLLSSRAAAFLELLRTFSNDTPIDGALLWGVEGAVEVLRVVGGHQQLADELEQIREHLHRHEKVRIVDDSDADIP